MKKSWLTVFALLLAAGVSGQAKYLTKPLEEKCKAKDLTFLVTFDKAGVNADYAKGEKYSTTMRDTNLGLRGVIGFDGRPAYQPEAGEMLRFPVKGNADPHKGTMILWTAGLDYAPGEAKTDDKSRGNIALAHLMFKKGNRFIEYQLYEYGDNVYFDWRSSDGPQGWGQVGRVGIPRKKIRKGEWHQLAATWDDHRLYCYLNGEKIGETALPRKVEMTADLKTFDKAKSFIGVKSPFYEDKHTRATAVDDFAIYSRPLSALEIRNQYAALVKDGSAAKPQAYALTLNGVDTGHGDKIDRLEVEVDFAALSEADQKKLDAGKLVMEYTLTGPDGKRQEGKWTFAKAQETRILKGVDQTGKYTLETKVGKDTVSASVERPDFSWVGNGYGDDDEVPAIWKDFAVAGRKVTLWNRVYEFGEGPLPETILAYGKPLLKERARLLIDGKEPVWSAGKTARTNRTVTFTGTGKLTTGEIRYATTVEFDGLIKFDWTIAGQPEIGKMELQWTMSPENKQFLMTPRVDETKEQQKEFKYPLSAGGNAKVLWFVSEKKGGFAFSMVNDANWVYDPAKPVFFADKSTGACRVAMITKKVKMPAETPYQALFIATPTRPLPELNRVIQYGDTRGGQKHMTNGGGDGGFKEIFTHEPHPTDFERKYRNAMENSCSIYGAASALTTQSPVARYLRKYWEVPGAYSYNMPYSRPLGNGKYVQERYFSLSACNACRINDYLLAAQHKLYTHKLAGKIWQVYYDLCGDSLCGNRLHGCAYKDKFGREVKSFEVLHKRDLIRRTVAYAHKYGKTVMIHAQRDFVPMMSGLADYYFPGEQYGALLRRNPYGYVDEVSDTIYRSEFNRNVLGVGVIHLPALGQADRANFKPEAFKYTEAMIAMLQSHDVETTQLWAAGKPVQRVWDILARYGVQHKDTVCRLYHEQNEITSSSPDVRVTYYICPEKRYVLFLANKDIRPCTTEIDVSKIAPGSFRAMEEYKEKPVEVKNGKFTIKVPARSFRIVAFPPCSGYPRKDSMTRLWPSWRSKKCDTKFELSKDGGTGGSPCLMQTCGETGGGCFLTHAKLRAGCTYVCKIKVRQKNGKQVSLTVQGRNGARLATVKKPGSEEWQELVLRFTVTGTGKWKNCDEVMITLGGSGPGAVTWFDDFEMEEIPAEGKK